MRGRKETQSEQVEANKRMKDETESSSRQSTKRNTTTVTTTTAATTTAATTPVQRWTYSSGTNDDLAGLVCLDNKLTRHVLGDALSNDGNRFDLTGFKGGWSGDGEVRVRNEQEIRTIEHT
jgi:hypothetical protein